MEASPVAWLARWKRLLRTMALAMTIMEPITVRRYKGANARLLQSFVFHFEFFCISFENGARV